MRRSFRERHGGRVLKTSLPRFTLCRTAAVLAAFALSAVADTEAPFGGDPVRASGDRTTPNQSISLEGAGPLTADRSPTEPRPSGGENTPGPVAGGKDRASESPLIPRSQRSPGAAGRLRNPAKLTAGQPVPWYRTGLGALTIVLVLVGLFAWMVKRWVPGARTGETDLLRVVARASLSPKHNVALVRVGHRFVLVGISGDKVNGLCEISEPDEVAYLANRTGTSMKRGTSGFDDLMFREEAGYHEAEALPDKPRAASPAERLRIREPLKDLLRRLRTLQVR